MTRKSVFILRALVVPVIALIAACNGYSSASAFSIGNHWTIGLVGAVLAGAGAALLMDVLLRRVVVPVLNLIVESRRVR